MSGPVTRAGRRLVKWSREGQVPWDVTSETVEDAEREAVALAMADLRARVETELRGERNQSDAIGGHSMGSMGFVRACSRVLALIDDATKGDGA